MNGSENTSDNDTKKCMHHQEKILYVPAPECSIYRVSKQLRKINEDAYTPHLISIGAYHHGKKELAEMENQKKRYRLEFVNRIGKEKFEKLEIFVKDREKDIRKCYADQASQILNEKFLEMILYDAVFIIELFLRSKYGNYGRDFLLDQLWLTNAIKLDLQLFENQLPYFVLRGLYRLAFIGTYTGEISPSFLSLSCYFFGYDDQSAELRKMNEENLKHFLDLRRYTMIKSRPDPEVPSKGTKEEGTIEEGKIQDLPCAVMLNEVGVTFKPVSTYKSLLDIKFQKGKRCIPLFNNRKELQIPRIIIEDSTECLMRNLMALEQCCYPSETHICNYVDLIDSLINTKKDVDLLFEKGIISNRVGDHTKISEMFNKLCLQITTSESCYDEIIRNLIEYHGRWWNRTKATLMSVYFRDIWRTTATAAAALLLILTVLQTMQRLWRGWTPPSK